MQLTDEQQKELEKEVRELKRRVQSIDNHIRRHIVMRHQLVGEAKGYMQLLDERNADEDATQAEGH